MENHDRAYHVWREAGVRGRTLVHVDAHHDMWWLPEKSAVTIANYVCPALREGLVRRVFWVVPDATFETSEGRRTIGRFLKRIASRTRAVAPRRRSATARRRSRWPVRTSRRASSARSRGSAKQVLLDLDVDFMVIPRVTWGTTDEHSGLPWCWPEELLGATRGGRDRDRSGDDCGTRSKAGSRPLRWKYLGDELAARLHRDGRDPEALRGFCLMRSAAEAIDREDHVSGERMLREAAGLVPCPAACWYRLALLNAAESRAEAARTAYSHALSLDPTYATGLRHQGIRASRRRPAPGGEAGTPERADARPGQRVRQPGRRTDCRCPGELDRSRTAAPAVARTGRTVD